HVRAMCSFLSRGRSHCRTSSGARERWPLSYPELSQSIWLSAENLGKFPPASMSALGSYSAVWIPLAHVRFSCRKQSIAGLAAVQLLQGRVSTYIRHTADKSRSCGFGNRY